MTHAPANDAPRCGCRVDANDDVILCTGHRAAYTGCGCQVVDGQVVFCQGHGGSLFGGRR